MYPTLALCEFLPRGLRLVLFPTASSQLRLQRLAHVLCRCLSQRWQRGGNASNSCTVLSLLGARCAFMGSLAPGHVADFLVADFRQRGVDVSQVTWQSQGDTPCSCCIVNNSNGSRTIILYDT